MPAQIALDFRPAPSDAAVHPALAPFHPVVQRWFSERVGTPSRPQVEGWPSILSGDDVLIAAPTGSGKTLSAFLAALDSLFRRALDGTLEDRTEVLYVSPLKALGNDVQKNLLAPLAQLLERARAEGYTPQPVRVMVRTGDTSASERAQMLKRPPHILITTPESLYLYLTAARGRETLRDVRTVIVDEIHALARDKRGSHFALSLERLQHLARRRPQRVGLSATQKPLATIARFLTGASPHPCRTVEVGHQRPWELSVWVPDDELGSLASGEMWGQLYDFLVKQTEVHRTTLVFVNTRKLAERLAHDLAERLGEGSVAAHHGSMSRELRLKAEERLKAGQLKALVATASLELGIDVGEVDLVVQVGSCRSIAVLLQRVGRAGHNYGGISRGVVAALTRDELAECTALLHAVAQGDLDAVRMPERPLDVLAQQLVAMCACEEWDERALFSLVRRAHPYRELTWDAYEKVLTLLSDGLEGSRGRFGVHLHRDRVNQRLRARRGARLLALTNGGAIPDTFTFQVVSQPDLKVVGQLDEDFAVESSPGDIFLLGSTSWRIRRVSGGTVEVEDAQGAPPNVPFWRGEAPGRTDELSVHVAALREALLTRTDAPALLARLGLPPPAADQLLAFVRLGARQLGALPTQDTLVAERFFDESGGMQLVIHAPFGSRINRAWGLALRKRFCRSFDFELQAAATEDGILLSLGEQHSFPLADIFDFLHPDTVEPVLVQAVLQAPLFPTRFRWSANRALALARFQGGKRVAPNLQRARSEDLLARVFPAQVGCQDNHGGADVEVPDHPLVTQSMEDCLREAMDVDGLRALMRRLKDGQVKVHAVDVPEPSVFAHALLHAMPYAFLDDAPAEERRARNVALRRTLPADDAANFGALDAAAIDEVVRDARPAPRDADELHEQLLQCLVLREDEAPDVYARSLVEAGRATWASWTQLAPLPLGEGQGEGVPQAHRALVSTERLKAVQSLLPGVELSPPTQPLPSEREPTREEAARQAVRGRTETAGPTTASELADATGLPHSLVNEALHHLESEGAVLRGTFRPRAAPAPAPVHPEDPGLADAYRMPPAAPTQEWCDRRLLQRIHRLTVGRLRKEIEPLSAQDFMRFLFRWHHVEDADALRGDGGLRKAIGLLQGYEAPASAWERFLLSARLRGDVSGLLERACYGGEVAWGRLTLREGHRAPGPRRGLPVDEAPPPGPNRVRPAVTRNAALTFVLRDALDVLLGAARGGAQVDDADLSAPARDVVAVLRARGACFFQEVVARSKRLPAEVEDALWELVARGLVTADAVQNLRVLQSPGARKRQKAQARGGPGRWSLLEPLEVHDEPAVLEAVARQLLQRYGIVWRDLALREALCTSWRGVLQVLRRMEARGEVRGGRFVAGFAGEQFALPEAVELSRQVRRQAPSGVRVTLSAVDPLNLTGVVTPGPRVPATVNNAVVYVDGVPEQVQQLEEPQEDADTADAGPTLAPLPLGEGQGEGLLRVQTPVAAKRGSA